MVLWMVELMDLYSVDPTDKLKALKSVVSMDLLMVEKLDQMKGSL